MVVDTGVTQVVPNWNDPHCPDAFAQLPVALGRRYDGNERLTVSSSGQFFMMRAPTCSAHRTSGSGGW